MAQCRRQVAVTRQHADLAEAVYLLIKVVNHLGPTNIRATRVLPEATETKDWTPKETAQGMENRWYCFIHMVAYYLLQIYLNLKFSFLFSLVFIFCSVSMGNKAPVAKREIRLIKNREAARECRRKKKEYIKVM